MDRPRLTVLILTLSLVAVAALDLACSLAASTTPGRRATDDDARRRQASALLLDAHSAYIAGHYRRARTLSQRLQDLYRDHCPIGDREIIRSGWAVMVAAACQLGDVRLANFAFRLDARRARLVRPICAAHGIWLVRGDSP